MVSRSADPATAEAHNTKPKRRFRLRHVLIVRDHGMLTAAGIEQTLRPQVWTNTLESMLLDNQGRSAAEARQTPPLPKTTVSSPAYREAPAQRVGSDNGECHPLHGFHTPLSDLVGLTHSTLYFGG